MKTKHILVSFVSVLYACGSPDSAGLFKPVEPPNDVTATPNGKPPRGFTWVDPHVGTDAVLDASVTIDPQDSSVTDLDSSDDVITTVDNDASDVDSNVNTDANDVSDSDVVLNTLDDANSSVADTGTDTGVTSTSDSGGSQVVTDAATGNDAGVPDAGNDADDDNDDHPDLRKCKWLEHGRGHHYGHFKQCLKGNVSHKVWCCPKNDAGQN